MQSQRSEANLNFQSELNERNSSLDNQSPKSFIFLKKELTDDDYPMNPLIKNLKLLSPKANKKVLRIRKIKRLIRR